jgi:hypothetical protein
VANCVSRPAIAETRALEIRHADEVKVFTGICDFHVPMLACALG